jgi:hypothetical protein
MSLSMICSGKKDGYDSFSISIGDNKIVLCRNPLIILSDALGGFAPAAAAPPVRIVPYYLYTKVLGLSGNTEESQAPPPPAGAGLAQRERSS